MSLMTTMMIKTHIAHNFNNVILITLHDHMHNHRFNAAGMLVTSQVQLKEHSPPWFRDMKRKFDRTNVRLDSRCMFFLMGDNR